MPSQPLPAGHDGAGATAAPRVFPYRDHRTMAEVMMSERIDASHLRMLGLRTPAAGNQLSQPPAVSARPDLGHNPLRNDAEGLGNSHVPHGISTSAEAHR
jgi:hypothetical protein